MLFQWEFSSLSINPLVAKQYNSTGVPVGQRFYLWYKWVNSGTNGLKIKIYIWINFQIPTLCTNMRVMRASII